MRSTEEAELEREGSFLFLTLDALDAAGEAEPERDEDAGFLPRERPDALEAALCGTSVPQELQNLAPEGSISWHATQVLTGVPH